MMEQTNTKSLKRLLALFLSILVVVAIIPLNVQATYTETVTDVETNTEIESKTEIESETDVETNTEITVAVKSIENGSITISSGLIKKTIDNHTIDKSLKIKSGEDVTIKVTPNEDYAILSVMNGQETITLSDGEHTFIENTQNLTLSVICVEVYQVTFNSADNGTIKCNNKIVETMTVINNDVDNKIQVTATPNTGYRVSEVKIDDEVHTSCTENNKEFDEEITISKPCKITVVFAKNVYKITVKRTRKTEFGESYTEFDEPYGVTHGNNVSIQLKTDDKYIASGVEVNDTTISDPTIKKESDGVYLELTNVTEDKGVVITYKEISLANDTDLTIDKSEDLGKSNDYIVIKKGSNIRFKATNDYPIMVYRSGEDVLGGIETKEVSINSTTTVDGIYLYYKADNELYADWHKVGEFGIKIVVDGTTPTATITPENANTNNCFNKSVNLDISVDDGESSSGLSSIEYNLYSSGNQVNKSNISLYNYDESTASPTDIITNKEVRINIDSETFNDCDLKVIVTVYDRAGNRTDSEYEFVINTAIPVANLTFTEDEGVNVDNYNYNGKRTLTINVTDSEKTFSEENFKKGLTITKNEEIIDVSNIQIESKHTCQIELSENGHYIVEFLYTNKAGSTSTQITHKFCIDAQEAPELKVEYDQTFSNVVLNALTFGFIKSELNVTVTATDTTSGVYEIEYNCIDETVENDTATDIPQTKSFKYDGIQNSVSETFKVSPQFRGKLTFSATDNSGQKSQYVENDGKIKYIVIDDIAPGVTVKYESGTPNYDSYYNSDRVATIEIKEDNFFGTKEWGNADLKDGLLDITVGKTYNDGRFVSESLKPEFTQNNDVYTAQILFNEEADYTFDIKYTDRSGNVFDSYQTDRFTIDKTAPVVDVSYDNNHVLNDKYFNKGRKATITVTEHNFNEIDTVIMVNDKKQDVKWEAVKGQPDVHKTTVSFQNDGDYTLSINAIDISGNTNNSVNTGESVACWDFVVDNSSPKELKITYNPTFEGQLLEGLTFGFFKSPLNVKIEATDDISGIDYFTYTYAVSEGVSNVNSGKKDISVDVDGTSDYAEFAIPAQFRGKVSFTATNKAGVSATYVDEKVIVVDTVAPGIVVEYSNNNCLNDKYYNANRTATIKIDEANYFEKDIKDGLLKITSNITSNIGITDKKTLTPKFTKNGDVYTATVKFDHDADYVFAIDYTDRAGNKSSYKSKEFTIDTVKPKISIETAEGKKFSNKRTAKITVVEHNFNASDFNFDVEGYDIRNNVVEVSAKSHNEYLKSAKNWTEVESDKWEAEVEFNIDANYVIEGTYSDLAGNSQEEIIEDNFCVDTNKPQNLKITYNNQDFKKVLIETVTFGFYNAPVEVTLEVTDDISGIDYFSYYYVNNGKRIDVDEVYPEKDDYSEGGTVAKISFELPAEFRGNISFTVYDKAGNRETLDDDREVVIDTIAPGVEVDFDSYNDNGYYDSNRTATIKINEANFFGTEKWEYADIEDEKIYIEVGKIDYKDNKTITNVKPKFEETKDGYIGKVVFDENADYTFDVMYTDRSGNKYDNYDQQKFTVDKIKPQIKVSYNDDDAQYSNGNQFRTEREATIVITEHNFDADLVDAKVKANDIDVTTYTEQLRDDKNWEHNGDVHTAKISFTDEAHYKFEISCLDEAGNQNDAIDYANSVAPTEFTLDKTAPTDMDIKINDKSVIGKMGTVAFENFYQSTITVKFSADCGISGMHSVEYLIKEEDMLNFNDEDGWKTYDNKNGVEISPNKKFVIYFKVEDKAGNVSYAMSDGIVVDDLEPIGEINAPEIDIIPQQANANGIHNGDVNVKLKVIESQYSDFTKVDSTHCSGLKEIKYMILDTDTGKMKEGTLLDTSERTDVGDAEYNDDDLIVSWSGSITVDSKKFNSNNVVVKVIAIDNAGNKRESETSAGQIKIDVTAPKIKVTYDNNEAVGSYFKTNRTATIAISERNFDKSKVVVTMANTDGTVPQLGNWKKTAGTGNMDDTVWTTQISYVNDGDYEFGIECTDLAGLTCDNNHVDYADSVAPTSFTIDKTLPTIAISYNNNSAMNTNYFKEARVATVVVKEHNFDPSKVDINITATENGVATESAKVTSWTTNGDNHTATITYNQNALYTFDIVATDKAGNSSVDFANQTFSVDTVAPIVEISGVENNSANNGNVIPMVSFKDTNYDQNQTTITLTGANRKNVEIVGSYSDIANGRVFTFKNFEKKKEIDDIYTLTAKTSDKAGNTSTQTITFSVNRFGSVYSTSESTARLNGTYLKTPKDIVVMETNANEVSDIKVTLFKNNQTIILSKGTDYKVEVTGGNGQWYQYTYTIYAKNFEEDGIYNLTIESNDAAGNLAKNDQDTKNTNISFGIDDTLPIINIENLESKSTYALEKMTVNMSVKDNLKLAKVVVILDGQEYRVWDGEELEEIVKNGGNFSFDIPGDFTDAHKLVAYAVDAAGNGEMLSKTDFAPNAEFVDSFYVTTNLWVRYYTNTPLFVGSIAGVILIAAMSVFVVVRKKRIKESGR